VEETLGASFFSLRMVGDRESTAKESALFSVGLLVPLHPTIAMSGRVNMIQLKICFFIIFGI
jgi:hypothetical protein